MTSPASSSPVSLTPQQVAAQMSAIAVGDPDYRQCMINPNLIPIIRLFAEGFCANPSLQAVKEIRQNVFEKFHITKENNGILWEALGVLGFKMTSEAKRIGNETIQACNNILAQEQRKQLTEMRRANILSEEEYTRFMQENRMIPSLTILPTL